MIISLVAKALIYLTTIGLTLKVYEKMGVSVFVFLFFTSSTLFPLILGLLVITPFVLVTKMSPSHVEATVYSISASVINSFAYFLPSMIGVFWNKVWFNVSNDNLDDLYKAYIFAMCASIFSLLYIRIIPTWDEVREVQESLKEINVQAQTALKIKRTESIEPYEGDSDNSRKKEDIFDKKDVPILGKPAIN